MTLQMFKQLGRDRQDRLYAAMCAIANEGGPLPTNQRLRELVGIAGRCEGALHRAIQGLVTRGLIVMEYGISPHYRRIRICETGACTEWACSLMPKKERPSKVARAPRAEKPIKVVRPRRVAAPRPPKPIIPRIVKSYPLLASRGMSDFTIYGHLADAVRVCRRAGDVVHRNEHRPVEILINGRPGDVKARAAWHASRCQPERKAA